MYETLQFYTNLYTEASSKDGDSIITLIVSSLQILIQIYPILLSGKMVMSKTIRLKPHEFGSR